MQSTLRRQNLSIERKELQKARQKCSNELCVLHQHHGKTMYDMRTIGTARRFLRPFYPFTQEFMNGRIRVAIAYFTETLIKQLPPLNHPFEEYTYEELYHLCMKQSCSEIIRYTANEQLLILLISDVDKELCEMNELEELDLGNLHLNDELEELDFDGLQLTDEDNNSESEDSESEDDGFTVIVPEAKRQRRE